MEFTTIDVNRLVTLSNALAPAAAGASNVQENVLIAASGDALVSRSFVDASGKGAVEIRGSIGIIPVVAKFEVSFSGEQQVAVTLDVSQPLPFKHTWTFNVGASSVALDPNTQLSGASAAGVSAAGISWWCVLKCGGLSILGTLLACLPAFAGGPAGYIACVVGKLGATAGGVAACIATDCL